MNSKSVGHSSQHHLLLGRASSTQPTAVPPLIWQPKTRTLPGKVSTNTHRVCWDPGGLLELQSAIISNTSPKLTFVCQQLLGIASSWQFRELHKPLEQNFQHRIHNCCWAELAAGSLLVLQRSPVRACWDPGGLLMEEEIMNFCLVDYLTIVIQF